MLTHLCGGGFIGGARGQRLLFWVKKKRNPPYHPRGLDLPLLCCPVYGDKALPSLNSHCWGLSDLLSDCLGTPGLKARMTD